MDEFDRIREALGAPQADDAAKARAWVRIQREITSDQPSRTRPTPISERDRRPPPRRRHAILLGIAAAIAFIAIVLQVVLPSGSGGPAVSAASELRRLADLAATIPPVRPGTGYLYNDVETRGMGGGEDVGSGHRWDILGRGRLP